MSAEWGTRQASLGPVQHQRGVERIAGQSARHCAAVGGQSVHGSQRILEAAVARAQLHVRHHPLPASFRQAWRAPGVTSAWSPGPSCGASPISTKPPFPHVEVLSVRQVEVGGDPSTGHHLERQQ